MSRPPRHICNFHVHNPFNTSVAIGSVVVGLILQTIACFGMEWSSAKTSKSAKGLWRYTYDDLSFEYPDSAISPHHHATRVLVSTANVLAWATLVTCPVHILESVLTISCNHRMHFVVSVFAIMTAVGTCICSIGAMLVWGLYVHDNEAFVFGAGFITCLTSAFLIALGGLEVYRATSAQHSQSRLDLPPAD